MKTTLRTRDRIILQNIMPTKGSYTDMSIITDVNSKVNLSQSEIKELDVTQKWAGNISWNPEKDTWKEIEFSKAECNVIKKVFSDLDEKKEITSDMMSLYDIFG